MSSHAEPTEFHPCSPGMSSSNEPLVSIVLTCFNSERFLEETLASVRAQTYRNWELLAVNDGSTDKTAQLLEAAAQLDSRIKHIRRTERSGQPGAARNTAIPLIQGSFVAFLDHDDLFLPEKLERQVALLKAHPECVAAFHDLDYIDANGKIISRYLPNFLKDAEAYLKELSPDVYICSRQFYEFQVLRYAGIHTISCMIARDRINGDDLLFNTEFTICEDTDMWIRLGLQGNLLYEDRPLSRYRQHDSSITKDFEKLHYFATRLAEYNLERLGHRLSHTQRQALIMRLASSLKDLGWSMRCNGKGRSAAKQFFRSFVLVPRWSTAAAILSAWRSVKSPH